MYAQAGFGLGWGLERGDCDLRVDEDTATGRYHPLPQKLPIAPIFIADSVSLAVSREKDGKFAVGVAARL
jgi:hypothetical protein